MRPLVDDVRDMSNLHENTKTPKQQDHGQGRHVGTAAVCSAAGGCISLTGRDTGLRRPTLRGCDSGPAAPAVAWLLLHHSSTDYAVARVARSAMSGRRRRATLIPSESAILLSGRTAQFCRAAVPMAFGSFPVGTDSLVPCLLLCCVAAAGCGSSVGKSLPKASRGRGRSTSAAARGAARH